MPTYDEEETIGRMPEHVARELVSRGQPIQKCPIHQRWYLVLCVECHPKGSEAWGRKGQ